MENILSGAPRRRKKLNKAHILIFVLLLLYTVFLFLPFYVVIITSFVSDIELLSSMSFIWWPKEGLSIEAYCRLFAEDVYMASGVLSMPSLLVGFLNSLWTTLFNVLCALFFGGLAAYSYSKVKFAGKNKLFMAQLATMMIPTACMTIPSYVFYDAIGWTYTFLPLIIPGMFGSATMIFFLRSYFDQVSDEYVEAAKIDGLGNFGIYVNVMMPIGIPAFVAQFIFAFVSGYNNYTGPLMYLYGGDPATYTLQIMLSDLRDFYSSEAVQCATAIAALLPLVVVYAFTQKLFIEGIAVGGVKG